MPCRVLVINVTALVTVSFLASTVICTSGICGGATGNPVVCVAGRMTRMSCVCNSGHIILGPILYVSVYVFYYRIYNI